MIAVTRTHERFYSPLTRDIPALNLIVQPQNRGTAPAILYSLLRLVDHAPHARVAIFASDHFVGDDRGFARHVEVAFNVVESRPELVVLLGVEPGRPETAYGWVEPGLAVRDTPAFMVRRFWEKPQLELAKELLGRGCLWNSFVMVGHLSAFLGLFMIALPSLYVSFRQVQPIFGSEFEKATVERLYGDLKSASFSDDVLARHALNLAVLPVKGVEWSDLGEPRRVMEVYERTGARPGWVAA